MASNYQANSTAPRVLVYKTVHQSKNGKDEPLDIPLDLYWPQNASSQQQPAPIPLIWVHTGGFLQGTRRFIPQHLIRACNRLNLALIAPDYRLAPQVCMDDIMQDVADCIRFTTTSNALNEQLAKSDPSKHIDTSNYIMAGSSAGGWTSLLLGLGLLDKLQPTLPIPLAVISIYPITTVSPTRAPYYSKPLKPLPFAYSPQANVGDEIPVDPLQPHLDVDGPVLTEAPPTVLTSRAPLYSYSRQEGIFGQLLFNESSSKSGKLTAETTCVPSLIESRLQHAAVNEKKSALTPKLVYIVVGDADVHVEPDQAQQAFNALKACSSSSFDVQIHIEPGKGHLWDIYDGAADVPSLWSSIENELKSHKA